jgi:hypothetical protein
MYRDDAAEDRSILVVGLNGRVLGMQRRTGQILWEHQLQEWVSGEIEILIHRGRVYALGQHLLLLIDYATGTKLRETRLPGTFRGRSVLLLDGDQLFIGTGGEVSCFDLDGNALWHDPLKGRGVGAVGLAFPGNARQADTAGSR